MSKNDVSDIVLTPEEEAIFSRFRDQDTAVLTRSEFALLHRCGLVTDRIGGAALYNHRGALPESGLCELSDLGKRLRSRDRKSKRKEDIQTRRYFLSLALAAAALVISILSILK